MGFIDSSALCGQIQTILLKKIGLTSASHANSSCFYSACVMCLTVIILNTTFTDVLNKWHFAVEGNYIIVQQPVPYIPTSHMPMIVL